MICIVPNLTSLFRTGKDSMEKTRSIEKQIRNAEINRMIFELTSDDKYTGFAYIYTKYLYVRNDNIQDPLREATRIIMDKYERPSAGSLDKRLAAAKRWYEYSNGQ